MSQINWNDKQQEYKDSDWSSRPSIFAEFAIDYFPEHGQLLELGAGVGQDSVFFANKSFEVTATDKSIATLESTVSQLDDDVKGRVRVMQLDLAKDFDLSSDSFDIVYAHLSLHYFDDVTTRKIFSEIYRVLKPGGVLAFFTNSINDPEYNTGTQIEQSYFSTAGDNKRYFSASSALEFASAFKAVIADEKGETYKDMAKGVHSLVRFIGTKSI